MNCVLWTGGTNKRNGYGVIYRDGGRILAHRDVYERAYGVIPDGMVVRHKCDVKLCVNPEHLELGTVADNNRDARERGQWKPQKGSAHGMAVLNESAVIAIRRRHAEGESQRELAAEYGVSQVMIGKIVRRDAWTHVA